MKKVDIESMIFAKDNEFSVKTMVHIHRLFDGFGAGRHYWTSNRSRKRKIQIQGINKLCGIAIVMYRMVLKNDNILL